MKSVLNIHWKDWCWSRNSNTLATWFEELTHWKRPWCWETVKVREGADRGWDLDSITTRWTWVWVGSRSWWWTGKLVCCIPWGHKDSDITEGLNWQIYHSLPGGSVVKNLPASVGDTSFIPWLVRCPREGNGYPLPYSCLGNSQTEESGGLQSMASQKSWAQLSD